MAAEEEAPVNLISEEMDSSAKSLLVTFRAEPRRRPAGARLAEGEIAAQHGEARRAECLSERNEERGGAIAACAMRQDKASLSGDAREVKESSNGHIRD
jgi:hypothetical protein